MSHGGGGGGGFGHHGGGHHGGHGGGFMHHGGGHTGGHGGGLIHHVLHALGIHGHGHGLHHHHGAGGHQPDQSPTWNMAMQGEKWWSRFFRVSLRPFALVFLLFFSAFCWLYIIYRVHKAEIAQRDGRVESHVASAPAAQQALSFGQQSFPSAPQQTFGSGAAAMEPQAAQFGMAAVSPGAYSAAPSALAGAQTNYAGAGYGGVSSAISPYAQPAAAATGELPQGYGSMDAATQMPFTAADAGLTALAAARTSAISAPRNLRHSFGGIMSGYAPAANGRQRLCVSR